MASGVYNRIVYLTATGQVNLSTNGVRCALVSSGYTFNKDDDFWKAATAPKLNEVTGTGYAANGLIVTGRTVTLQDASDNVKFDGNDVVWSASSVTARFAIVYVSNATLSNPLVACYDFGSDKTSASGNFTVQWSTAGILTGAPA